MFDFDGINGAAPSGDIVEIFLTSATGIETIFKNGDLNVSPNPTSSSFTISGVSFTVGDEIILSDVMGKIIFTKKITAPTSSFKLQTLNFSSGIYFLQLKTKEGMVNKKVVVGH